LKAIGDRCVRLLRVPLHGSSCELVFQEIEQAVESGVCKVSFRHSRRAIQSQAPSG
jgi:fructose/tagatose bisphosphate aldolase